MSVCRLLDEMDAEELAYWYAYEELEASGWKTSARQSPEQMKAVLRGAYATAGIAPQIVKRSG